MLDFIKDLESNFAGKKITDFSLDGMKNALEILGNPEKKLKNVIHIAGTNGKGSVATFLHSILTKSGYKTHKYTSPHLEVFNERITIYNRIITDEEISQIKDEIWGKIENFGLTFFEITTIIAFCAFAKNPAEFVILETGLGGRLDATNIFKEKLFSIITSISLDHQAILGETLREIANEKSEIIRGSKYCISSFFEKNQEIIDVIEEKAEKFGSKLYISRKTFLANGSSEDDFCFKFSEFDFKIKQIKSGISGIWQIENSALAIAVCVILKNHENFDKITKNSIKIGVQAAKIKGRMTELEAGLIKKIFGKKSKNFKVIIDISHNQDGIEKFCNQIRNIHNKIAIFSQLNDKKSKEIYQLIAKAGFEKFYCVEINSPRKCDVNEIKSDLGEYFDEKKIFAKSSFEEIFYDIKNTLESGKIYVFGSNFLVSDFLKFVKNINS